MRQITLFLICLASAMHASAQLQVEDSATISRERWRDSVFRMNMSYVPSGILAEYSLYPFEATKYDGLNNDDDTIKSSGYLYMLHDLLKASIVNNNAQLPVTDSLYAYASSLNKITGEIPFTLVYQTYHRIRSTALSEGLFTINADSVGIQDVLPRAASPYDAQYAFFAAPFNSTVTKFGNILFSFRDSLWRMPGIDSISIDFNDGSGFRNIKADTTVSIYYSTPGVKIVVIKINTAAGIRTTKCMITYSLPYTFTIPSATWNISVTRNITNDSSYLASGRIMTTNSNNKELIDFTGQSGAEVQVEYGCDDIFDKPIIILEGFDPDGKGTIDELRKKFSRIGLISILKAAGYDFLFVNLTSNTDYIENNAKVLEAIIEKVNQEKTGTYKITVIGYSMGGIIARWCLKDMEDRAVTHNVENYFSVDAPHQGANIPLGLQYLFKEISIDFPYLKWLDIGGFGKLANAYDSPAARQMLVKKAIYDGNKAKSETLDDLRSKFAQKLLNKGYPQLTHNYGISFGRGNNTANTKDAGNGAFFSFTEGSQIFGGNLTWGLANFTSSAYIAKSTNDYVAHYKFGGLTFRKLFGLVTVPVLTLRFRNFKTQAQYPYDEAPGGYLRTQKEFAESLNGTNPDGLANGAAGIPSTYNNNGHNFVPLVSALDIQDANYGVSNGWQSSNLFYNIDNLIQNNGTVSGNTLSTASLSPFEAVQTSTISTGTGGTNIWHKGELESDATAFIIRKILNAIPTVTCTTAPASFCNLTPVLSGSSTVCSNSTYTVTGFPSGLILNWTSKYGRFSITAGQGTNQISISKLSTGVDTVILSLTNPCGLTTYAKYGIFLGAPIINQYVTGTSYEVYNEPGDITLYNQICNLVQTTVQLQILGASTATWTRTYASQSNTAWSQTGNNLSFYFYNAGQQSIFKATAYNGCGTAYKYLPFTSITCGGSEDPCASIVISPNPASSVVNIVPPSCESSVQESSSAARVASTPTSEADINWKVTVYDATGIVRIKKQFTGTANIPLNVSTLQNGVYFVEISNGIQKKRKSLIIKH